MNAQTEAGPIRDAVAQRAYSFTVLNTHDADEQAQSVRQWNQTYDQISPGAFEGRVIDAWFGDIQLFRETTNQAVHQGGSPWPDSLALAVPLSMDGEAFAHGRSMGVDMIFTVDSRRHDLDFVTPRALDLAAIAVGTRVIDRFCREVEGLELDEVMSRGSLIHCDAACMAKLRVFLLAVFGMLQTNHAVLAQVQIREALQDAVLTNVFATLAAGDQETVPGGVAGHRRVIERAKLYLLSRPDDPVTIAQLCRTIGVSRRKLQYCFQEVLGYNPLHYLRAVRLNRARRDLKSDTVIASVQDIAARWGFWHLSHFSADYKHMFGELPSETLRRRCGRTG